MYFKMLCFTPNLYSEYSKEYIIIFTKLCALNKNLANNDKYVLYSIKKNLLN